MKQIEASEVKPGMEVEWTQAGVTIKCVPETVDSLSPRYGVNLYTSEGGLVYIPGNAEVTVLAEPAPAQPEEPTEFGARAVMDGRRFLRSPEGRFDVQPWLEEDKGTWRNWDELCTMGPVTVIPDQGWTVPDDTPEVPDRITEWPEDDTALRSYSWRDALGIVWRYGVHGREHGWSTGSSRAWKGLIYGPWHREKGAEVPDRIEEEWPEDDEHLREHKWRDRDGYRWTWIVADAQWECRDDITQKKTMTAGIPADGPWTRVTDA